MDVLFSLFESITVLSIVKWLMIVFLSVYTVFAYLMVRQVKLMTRAVTMRDDYVIRILATSHFVFALLVLVLSILIL